MPASIEISVEKQMLVPIRAAFDVACAPDFIRVFRRVGPVPGVQAVEGESLPWASVGQQRRLLLEDGTSVAESLLSFDPPNSYRYKISGFEGLAGSLIKEALGEWRFTSANGGECSVQWVYRFSPHDRSWPHNAIARGALAAFAQLLWRAYMQKALTLMARKLENDPNTD